MSRRQRGVFEVFFLNDERNLGKIHCTGRMYEPEAHEDLLEL
jgi:hypothetical protein